MGALEELVAKAGGCAVIDGDFATQLEALGADINDPLWSAACLIARPHLVKEVTALAPDLDAVYYWFIDCRLTSWAMQCNPQQMPSDYCVSVRRGPREINYCCASCECEDTEFARVADDIFLGVGDCILGF